MSKAVVLSDETKQIIRERYAEVGATVLGNELGLKPHKVVYEAKKLGVRFYKASGAAGDVVDEAIRARYATEQAKDIAAELGLTSSAVASRANLLGLRKKIYQHAHRDVLVEKIRARYAEEGPWDIAAEHNLQPMQVCRLAWKLGVKTDSELRLKSISRERRPNLVRDFFVNWSGPMAYAIGYIYADGCVMENDNGRYGLHLACHPKDDCLLNYLLKTMRYPLELSYGWITRSLHGNPPKPYFRCSARMYDQELIRPLMEIHGLCQGKSYKDVAMPEVPEEYFSDFFRGYFDGDGSAAKAGDEGKERRINLVGGQRFITAMKHRVVETLGLYNVAVLPQTSSDLCFSVTWQSYRDVRKLSEWMYRFPCPFALPRKRKRLERYIISRDLSRWPDEV